MVVKKKKDPNFLKGIDKGSLRSKMGAKPGKNLPVSAVDKLANAKPGTKVKVGNKTVTASKSISKEARLAKSMRKWKR